MIEYRLFRRCLWIGLSWILIAQVQPASATLITLEPSSALARPGEAVSFDLVVSGFGDSSAPSLGAFDISITFNETVLSFSSYHLGSFLGDLGLFEAIDLSAGAGNGVVNISQLSFLSEAALDALQPAEFLLASFTFEVARRISGAQATVAVSPSSLLINAHGTPLTITHTGSAEIPVAVSAPGTASLVGAVLLGWLLLPVAGGANSRAPVRCAPGREPGRSGRGHYFAE